MPFQVDQVSSCFMQVGFFLPRGKSGRVPLQCDPAAQYVCIWHLSDPPSKTGYTQQDNQANFGPNSPLSIKVSKGQLSAGSKDYLVRYSHGVRCVQSDFTLPDLL